MNFKSILSAVALFAGLAVPAAAADVDIVIDTKADEVIQLNLAGAAALNKVTLDQTNAVEVVSIVGKTVNDVDVSQKAVKIAQGNGSIAVAFDPASTLAETQTNALEVLSVDIKTTGWSDIAVDQVANKVIQANLALAGAGKSINLAQANVLGAINITVND